VTAVIAVNVFVRPRALPVAFGAGFQVRILERVVLCLFHFGERVRVRRSHRREISRFLSSHVILLEVFGYIFPYASREKAILKVEGDRPGHRIDDAAAPCPGFDEIPRRQEIALDGPDREQRGRH
jgi:hypothetical protein